MLRVFKLSAAPRWPATRPSLKLSCFPLQGPTFPEPLVSLEDLEKLENKVNIQKTLGYVFDAITLTRHKLEGKVPLIGFSGAPVGTNTPN